MNDARAVLWDMDGTLIDSEEFHWESWRQTMANEGLPITREKFLASFGQRNDSILQLWLGPSASAERMEAIANGKERLYRTLIRKHGIAPLPGVADWVSRLSREGWFQVVASSAPSANIKAVLEALNAAEHFQGVVSAEDVRRGKPDPEVFLTAAARVNVEPARCIVVEDAVAGVEAARNAGMRSIGVSRNGKLLAANIVVKSLDQLDPGTFDALVAA
jgi:beta-phosphoglucomutase family hydrolase